MEPMQKLNRRESVCVQRITADDTARRVEIRN